MSRHTHPLEPRTADVVEFPSVLAHWPADAVERSQVAPLPSQAGVLVWRPARAALFWCETDEAGRIALAWPMQYAVTEHQVLMHAEHRPCVVYRETWNRPQAHMPAEADPAPSRSPKRRSRTKGVA